MWDHRRRRWAIIKPTLFQCVVFAGNASIVALDVKMFRGSWLREGNRKGKQRLCFCMNSVTIKKKMGKI